MIAICPTRIISMSIYNRNNQLDRFFTLLLKEILGKTLPKSLKCNALQFCKIYILKLVEGLKWVETYQRKVDE